MAGNIYFPTLNPLKIELHVSSTVINLTLTLFMIFQGLAPTFVGDLADMDGRLPAYIITFIIYIGTNIGQALQKNYIVLILYVA
jgi:MFS family permease